ncbi:twin-arginine translocase TatA/TatE family subunit [Demequina lutea]|uniref:Sec-independent protein translocase protein TatB n=1 Tax=Demequina lutea TaxID=431489 RepID=A0A7Y9ZBD3_9MICO|nr:twin-arginine translocase TatA/TatE family subunit [Demequina lutea]NYI42252.1 sec-independent protein translocase protein TatB [Demequina lutea]
MDINPSEFLVIALLALILVGPERLPEYVRGLRGVVLRLRALIKEGQTALKEELGDDVDWSQLDPRTYDPRRIVREALFDDEDATPAAGTASVAALATGAIGTASTGSRRERRGAKPADVSVSQASAEAIVGGATPFDPEAT